MSETPPYTTVSADLDKDTSSDEEKLKSTEVEESKKTDVGTSEGVKTEEGTKITETKSTETPEAKADKDKDPKAKDESLKKLEDSKKESSKTPEEKEELERRYELIQNIAKDRQVREQKNYEEKWGTGRLAKIKETLFGTTVGKVAFGGVKVIGGGIAVAAGASGALSFFSPFLFGVGSRFVGEGAAEIIAELAGGRQERNKISGKSKNLESQIITDVAALEAKLNTMPKAEYEAKVKEIVDALEGKQREIESDRKTHYKHEGYRKVASKVVGMTATAGAMGLFGGVPLGIHTFGGIPGAPGAPGHAVWATGNLLHGNGLDFLYHSSNEATALAHAGAQHNPIWHLDGIQNAVNVVNQASHTMGQNVFNSLGHTAMDRMQNMALGSASLLATVYGSFGGATLGAVKIAKETKANFAKVPSEVLFPWSVKDIPGAKPDKAGDDDKDKSKGTLEETKKPEPKPDESSVLVKSFAEKYKAASKFLKAGIEKGKDETPERYAARIALFKDIETPLSKWVKSVEGDGSTASGILHARHNPDTRGVKLLKESLEAGRDKGVKNCVVITISKEVYSDEVKRNVLTESYKKGLGISDQDTLIILPDEPLSIDKVREYVNVQSVVLQNPENKVNAILEDDYKKPDSKSVHKGAGTVTGKVVRNRRK